MDELRCDETLPTWFFPFGSSADTDSELQDELGPEKTPVTDAIISVPHTKREVGGRGSRQNGTVGSWRVERLIPGHSRMVPCSCRACLSVLELPV